MIGSLMTQIYEQFGSLQQHFNLKKPTLVSSNDLYKRQDQNSVWPQIKIPYDGEYSFEVFKYDWADKKLTSQNDMNVTIYSDATYNRVLMMTVKQPPHTTHLQREYDYWDFNARKQIKYRPNDARCYNFDIKGEQIFNLKNFIDLVTTPEGEITKYFGVQTLRWEEDQVHKKQFYTFRIDHNWFGQEVSINIYFDFYTKDLAWIEVSKPDAYVFQLKNGILEREFTDEDYKEVLNNCPIK
eukprot:403375257